MGKISKLRGTKIYSVVGVDDIMITAPEVTVKNLVSLYHWCFFDSGLANPVLTTRLGIPLDEVGHTLDEPDDTPLPQSAKMLQRICENLRERSWAIYNGAEEGIAPCNDWVRPLPKLSDTLVRMAHTPVLDEFIYLMLPGVQAFLANVEAHFNDLSSADREMCRVFVENWTDLLVPRLCSRIQAQELYPVQSTSIPGLVLVTIPFQMLYRPEEVQLALAHEASHFAGEENRCRNIRLDCFIESAAPLVAREIFGTMAPAVAKGVEENIQEFFHGLEKTVRLHTMEDIRLQLNVYLRNR